MARALIKMVVIAMVLVAGAFFLFGYWTGGSFRVAPAPAASETSRTVDTRAARERGAEIGEKAAMAAASVSESIEEGSLTEALPGRVLGAGNPREGER